MEYNRLVSRGPGELPFRIYIYIEGKRKKEREIKGPTERGTESEREWKREREGLVNATFPPRQRKKIEK